MSVSYHDIVFKEIIITVSHPAECRKTNIESKTQTRTQMQGDKYRMKTSR